MNITAELVTGIAVFIFGVVWVVLVYNRATKYVQMINEQRQNIVASLKKRYELLPGLVDIAGNTGQYERLLQDRTALLRSLETEQADYHLQNQQKFSAMEQQVGKVIISVKENYPTLKAPASFDKLRTELVTIENDLAGSRRLYNGAAALLYEQFGQIPNKFFVTALGFKPEPFFEFDIASTANVGVDFSQQAAPEQNDSSRG